MKNKLLYGLAFALLWEGAMHVTVLRHPKVFFLIFLTYIPIILVYSPVTRFTVKKELSPGNLIFTYLLCGVIGLFIEWNLLGNSPSGNPKANQIGMFCFWSLFGVIPYLMQDKEENSAKLKRNFKISYAILFILSWSLGIILPMPARFVIVLMLMIIGYIWLNGYFFRFIAQRSENPRAGTIAKVTTGILIVSALVEQYLHSLN